VKTDLSRDEISKFMNDRGSVLLIALLVLLMATIICIFMVTRSTLETRIAGNDKMYTAYFYGAESGLAPGIKVLLDTIEKRRVGSYDSLTWTPGTQSGTNKNLLLDEVLGFGSSPSGRGFIFKTLDNDQIHTEVRLQREKPTTLSPGGSAEFGSGYETPGHGSNGGVQVLYLIRSTALSPASAPSNTGVTVEVKYRKVLNAGEGK
jgi:hypothetical protein